MTAPVAGTTAALYAADAAYRRMLAETSLSVIRLLVGSWRTVDSKNLAGSADQWLSESLAAILQGHSRATQIADVYTTTVRRLVVPDAPTWTPPPPEPPNEEQIRKSLIYTGLATTGRELGRIEAVREQALTDPEVDRESEERTAAGVTRKAMEAAIARAAGAATRHVTTGGRDKIEQNVLSDPSAGGWVRVTKAGSCYYCAMLASRGPLYKEDSFKASDARFENHPVNGVSDQKVHDNCGCGLRPWYEAGEDLPERVQELGDSWAEWTTGYSGDEAIYHFRLRYEGRAQPR